MKYIHSLKRTRIKKKRDNVLLAKKDENIKKAGKCEEDNRECSNSPCEQLGDAGRP